jgi:hypothetical protein
VSRRVQSSYIEDLVCVDVKGTYTILIIREEQKTKQIPNVTLKSKDENLYIGTTNKTSILNQLFQTVYSKEDLSLYTYEPRT